MGQFDSTGEASFRARSTGASSTSLAAPGHGPAHGAANGESWFAVWTRSRHEQVVCTELAAREIEVFLPTVIQISHWKDRTKEIAWPLFPGYCFARFDPSQSLSVKKCNGVV